MKLRQIMGIFISLAALSLWACGGDKGVTASQNVTVDCCCDQDKHKHKEKHGHDHDED